MIEKYEESGGIISWERGGRFGEVIRKTLIN